MKLNFLLLCLAIISACTNPEPRKLTTELGYFPEQHADISDDLYRRSTSILKKTYEQIEEENGLITYGDHINIATAYIQLKEPRQAVLDQWFLAQEKNLESSAEIFPLVYPSPESVEDYLTHDQYDSMREKFATVMANKVEIDINPTEYALENGFDQELVTLIAALKESDQEFRSSDLARQQVVDQLNIEIIDSLFDVHQQYIGKELVGEEYSHTMWLVIQHSDLDHQEKYLPVVHQEVLNGMLHRSPLKMLIDRVHKKKYGSQIFGSQSGGDLADDETIEKVKQEYGI